MIYYPEFIKLIGGIESATKTYGNLLAYRCMTETLQEALILKQIVFWTPHMKIKRDGELWAAKRAKDWLLECAIDKRSATRVLKSLQDQNLIVVKNYHFCGVRQNHIRIDYSFFITHYFHALLIIMAEGSGLIDIPKLPNPYFASCQYGNMQVANIVLCKLPNRYFAIIRYYSNILHKILQENPADKSALKNSVFKKRKEVEKIVSKIEEFLMKRGFKEKVEKKRKVKVVSKKEVKRDRPPVIEQELKTVAEIVKMDFPQVKKVGARNLSEVWNNAVQDFDNEDTLLTKKKDFGQFKMLLRYIESKGVDPTSFINYSVDNWSLFCYQVESIFAVESLPAIPNIGFLLKYKGTMLAVFKGSNVKVDKGPAISCTPVEVDPPLIIESDVVAPATIEEIEAINAEIEGGD